MAQTEQLRERETLDPASDQWRPESQPALGTPDGDLDAARAALVQGKPGGARTILKDWLKQNPDHPRALEAQFLLGESYYENKNYWKALEQYTAVAENAAGDLFYAANRRAIDVARAFLAGEKRRFWVVFRLPAYDDGVEALDRVYERLPGTRLGEDALKLKADYLYETGDLNVAQDQYANLAKEYPTGRFTQLAMLRAAESAEASFPGVKYDDRGLLEAETRYKQVQAAFPDYAEREGVSERLVGIRRQRADKDLEVARWYERVKQTGAATYYYRKIVSEWPDSLAAIEAGSRLRALGVETSEAGTSGAGGTPDGPRSTPSAGGSGAGS